MKILLDAFERAGKDISYFALDLSLKELQRTLAAVPKGHYKHVQCFGLHGTYDDGLAWLSKPDHRMRPKCILSLGSSLGNFPHSDAGPFLKGFAEILQPSDTVILGLDACHDPDRVFRAYNDRKGVTEKFNRHGLDQANQLLGKEVFKQDEWQVIGEYDEKAGRHRAFYIPLKDISFEDILLKKGERIRFEESWKYSPSTTASILRSAGLVETGLYGNTRDDYRELIFPPMLARQFDLYLCFPYVFHRRCFHPKRKSADACHH